MKLQLNPRQCSRSKANKDQGFFQRACEGSPVYADEVIALLTVFDWQLLKTILQISKLFCNTYTWESVPLIQWVHLPMFNNDYPPYERSMSEHTQINIQHPVRKIIKCTQSYHESCILRPETAASYKQRSSVMRTSWNKLE